MTLPLRREEGLRALVIGIGTLTTEEWKADTATGVEIEPLNKRSTNQFLSIESILLPNKEGWQHICEQAKQECNLAWIATLQMQFLHMTHPELGVCAIQNWMASLILAQDKRWRRA